MKRDARFAAIGWAAFLIGQVLFNLLVVKGIIRNPASGVSLPFVSYGGSQLVMELAVMGGVLALARCHYESGAEKGSQI